MNKYMKEAIKEAKKAEKIGEMPIGAVIVLNEKIISRGYNKKESLKDVSKHAEMIAIQRACKKIGDWRLNKCSIYITMEPCIMCMGAIVEARIENIICGIENTKSNHLNKKIIKNYNINIKYGIQTQEITDIMNRFFKLLRNR